jgi:hypothetical protein
VTALNNATANELVTVGSTTTELDAESNLTFNGTSFEVENSSNGRGVQLNTNSEIKSLDGASWLHLQRYVDGNVAIGNNSNANLYVANKIGIGTSSPSAKLHIAEGFAYIYKTNDVGKLELRDSRASYDAEISQRSDGRISLATRAGTYGSNGSIEILDSGSVGIGTTSPGEKLDLRGGNFRVGGFNTGSDYGAIFTPADSASYWHIYNDTNGELAFGRSATIGSSEKMRIDSSGNVGIGQTSPSARLDVVASGNTGIEVTGGDGYLAGYFATSFDYVSKFVSTDASAAIVIEDSNSTSNANRVQVVGDVMELVASNSKRIELSSGSVVINQDSDNVNFRVESNGNQNMLFVDGGNDRVGIGTNSPAGTLHVEDSDGSNLARFKDSDSSYAGIIIAGDTNGGHIGNSGGYAGEGIYFQDSAEVMRFYAAGSEQMRLTGTGRLGIGTSSPDRKLHVQGSAIVSSVFKGTSATGHLIDLVSDNATDGYNGIRFYETTNHRMSLSHIQTGTRGYMQIGNSWASGSEILVVDGDNQRVGIGTTSPGAKLDVDVAGSNGGMRVISSSDSKIAHFRLAGGSRELLQIGGESDSVSKVQIGTSATSAPAIEIDSSDDVKITESLGIGVAASSTTGRLDCSNDVVAFSTSDKRLKENIKPLDSALDKVLQISGVEFDWKELTEEEKKTIHGNEGHDVGVIAQEIEEVLPEVVTTRDSGYKAVKYEKIVPLLIEAIKEQQQQIEELKNG